MASFKVRTRARALSPSSPARATPSPQDAIPSARARDERRVEARLAALREAAALRAAAAEEEASPEPVATLEVAPLPDHHARRPLLAVDTLHAAATRGGTRGSARSGNRIIIQQCCQPLRCLRVRRRADDCAV